jgi:hypothetical protein
MQVQAFYQQRIVTAEPECYKQPVIKPGIGHDPEPDPPSTGSNYLLNIHLNVILYSLFGFS